MGATGMKIGVFLQVRLGSTRLPGKALLPLEGRSVIEHAMDALSVVKADVYALLTDSGSVEALEMLAERCGFETFEGPAEDVLKRYALAAEHYGVDTYIRATGDNPLVSGPLAEELLSCHIQKDADYSGYLGPPLGTGVEITRSAAVLSAVKEASDPYEREHVSPFLYRRPERFSINRPWAPKIVCLPGAKVTLDTAEDYEALKEIYGALYQGEPIQTHTLVAWLKNRERSNESDPTESPVYTVDQQR